MALHHYSAFSPGTIYLRSGDDDHFWVVLSDPSKDQVKGKLEENVLQRIREGAAKSENILQAGPALLREQGFIT